MDTKTEKYIEIQSGWWFQTFGLFSIIYGYIWDVILPIDELIFFKMVIAKTNQ